MVEKKRLTEDEKQKNNEIILQVVVLTAQIKSLIEGLSGMACKGAYENSVTNLETKNVKWMTKESFQISDDEKELLRKFREGQIIIKEKKN